MGTPQAFDHQLTITYNYVQGRIGGAKDKALRGRDSPSESLVK